MTQTYSSRFAEAGLRPANIPCMRLSALGLTHLSRSQPSVRPRRGRATTHRGCGPELGQGFHGRRGRLPHTILPCLIVAIILVGCSQNEPPKTGEALTGLFPTSKARNTVTIFTTAGIKTTEIFSDSVVNFAEKDSTLAYGLRVNFYDNSGVWSSLLIADSGVIRERTEQLEVFGHVDVTTRDSVRVQTTQLAWNPKTSKIMSDSLVTIIKPGGIFRGWGMESDPDLKHLTLKKHVSGRIENYQQALDST